MKLFHGHGNCYLKKVLKTSARPSISLILFLLATILILPSFASAEVKKEYYPSGKLKSEVNVVDGKVEGLAKMYYENGNLKAEENYINGKYEGISKTYYESGQLKQEGNHKNDMQEAENNLVLIEVK